MSEALAVGCRVRKIRAKLGDAHADGAEGEITSVFGHNAEAVRLGDGTIVPAGTYGYFVQWDDVPPGLPASLSSGRTKSFIYVPRNVVLSVPKGCRERGL